MKIFSVFLNFIIFTGITFSGYATASDESSSQNFYFVIKGGVSLGSYETGLNRVVLKALESSGHRVKGFSGASAGSINGILSVIESCIPNHNPGSSENQVDAMNNIMRRTWDMGINDLIPEDAGSQQNIEDVSMFSRNAYQKKKDEVMKLLSSTSSGCDMSLTMSVTKWHPLEEPIQELGAVIKQQRFIVPLKVTVNENTGKLKFSNRLDLVVTNDPQKNNPNQQLIDSVYSSYMFLPEGPNDEINHEHIWKLALASSAFPVAFQPVSLDVCFVKGSTLAVQGKNYRCTDPESHLFSDGGLFDNAPIGVALDLSAKDAGLSKTPSLSSILYINPDFYRYDKSAFCIQNPDSIHCGNVQGNKSRLPVGLAALAGYFGNVALTAHEKEYSESIKALKNRTDVQFYSSSRFHHLTADFHQHFAAFYADEYRVHDYLVGMYDGYHFLALQECRERLSSQCLQQRLFDKIESIKPAITELNPVNSNNSTSDEAIRFNQRHHDFLRYLLATEYPKSGLIAVSGIASGNIYIALNKAFGSFSKGVGESIDYTDFITRFAETPGVRSMTSSKDIETIIDHGRAYTERKITRMVENLISLQETTGRCANCKGAECVRCLQADCSRCEQGDCPEACRTARLDQKIGKYLKTLRPFISAGLAHHRSNIWPKSYDTENNFSFDVRYGFNAQQKNQVFTVSARSTTDWLSQSAMSIDYGVDINRFGAELGEDNYHSVHLALTKHYDDMRFTSASIGYQWNSEGKKIYMEEFESVFIAASFLNELVTVKLEHSVDDIINLPVDTRDDTSLTVSLDVIQTGRFFKNLLF